MPSWVGSQTNALSRFSQTNQQSCYCVKYFSMSLSNLSAHVESVFECGCLQTGTCRSVMFNITYLWYNLICLCPRLPAAGTAKAIAVLQDHDAQQKCGELLPEILQRRPPAARFHHRPAAPFPPTAARLSPHWRTLAVRFTFPQPQPFHLLPLSLAQPFPLAARQASLSSNYSLFSRPCFPQTYKLPALQAHDSR